MPTSRKKNELLFPMLKGKKATVSKKEAMAALGLTKEEYEDFLKKKPKVQDIRPLSVRMKLAPEVAKKFDLYVSLAIEEGKATKKAKTAAGEVATFAVEKLMKSDPYFKAKWEEKVKGKK